ncbi:hypothetical protein QYE76_024967 [Lolium multiflorum]|uniref:tyrosine--tRNA ligase n=1 Tax=Lolium multiflorum TaxID=4521 RepID=A0AAD8REQ3_LOLMU|nr:hypothetical protein QYE76_024967 [Lolium multiflorum]
MSYKIGIDLNKIRTTVCYNIEVWKAAGMDFDRVELVLLSDIMNTQAANFWQLFMDICQKNTVDTIKRCCRKTIPYGPGILGVTELLLPCLQCAAMLFQKHLSFCSLEQGREAEHRVGSELYRSMGISAIKYIPCVTLVNGGHMVVGHGSERGVDTTDCYHFCFGLDYLKAHLSLTWSTDMIPDLLQYPKAAEKLDPGRAISMEDTEDDVSFKIMFRAFCPPQAVKHNPCLEYVKYIILPCFGKFEVIQERNGHQKIFTNMEMLITEYKCGTLHAADTKLALAKAINKILQPVHEHFRNNADAKKLREANKEHYLKH